MVAIDCASQRNVTLEGRHVRIKARLVMWVKDDKCARIPAFVEHFKIWRYMILKFQLRNKSGPK